MESIGSAAATAAIRSEAVAGLAASLRPAFKAAAATAAADYKSPAAAAGQGVSRGSPAFTGPPAAAVAAGVPRG